MAFNFDNSMLGDFAGCEAQAIAKHVFGLQGKKLKLAADIGNAYHSALEKWFLGGGKLECVQIFEEEYNKIIPPEEQPEEPRFARENCIKIMERFCDVRPVDSFPFIAIEAEKVKGIALDGVGEFIFWVKRDLLARDKVSGVYYPVDHKTTARLTDYWARTHRLTSQLSGYCWFTGIEVGQDVRQAYINGVEVGKLPDSMRRCAVHGKKYVECGVEHANFQLYQYTRTPEQLAGWKQDAMILAKKAKALTETFGAGGIAMLKFALKQGAFNNGCVFCEFKEWCTYGFAPEMAEEFTVYDRWEPWLEGERIDLKKGYEGLVPGTDDWMKYWKENPGEQEGMVEYANSLTGK